MIHTIPTTQPDVKINTSILKLSKFSKVKGDTTKAALNSTKSLTNLVTKQQKDLKKNLNKAQQDLEFKIKHNILNIFDIKHIDTSNIRTSEELEQNIKSKLFT